MNGRTAGPIAARRRAGLTLMEVVLAIAILGVAMAIIGELVRLGSRSAATARQLAVAQLLCESKMAELAAGVTLPEPAEAMPFELETDWYYSIDVEPTDREGLLAVRVTVQQLPDATKDQVSFSLVRWLPDPNYIPPREMLEEGTTGSETDQTSPPADSSATGTSPF